MLQENKKMSEKLPLLLSVYHLEEQLRVLVLNLSSVVILNNESQHCFGCVAKNITYLSCDSELESVCLSAFWAQTHITAARQIWEPVQSWCKMPTSHMTYECSFASCLSVLSIHIVKWHRKVKAKCCFFLSAPQASNYGVVKFQ